MKAVIDRVEEELAVLPLGDKGEFKLNFLNSLLRDGCWEGDILNISMRRDLAATSMARERVSGLMNKLKKMKSQGETDIIRGPEVK